MNKQINSTESRDVKPCRKCGARDRNKSSQCKPCRREINRKYRKIHREHRAEYNRNWRKTNPEKLSDYNREYYETNRERVAENNRKWQKANPKKVSEKNRKWKASNTDKVNVDGHNRRAKVRGNGGKLSKDIVERLIIAQGGKCACCGADLKQTGHHLDHIMPLALGGLNADENVQLLTPTCNMRKGAKHPDDWKRLAS